MTTLQSGLVPGDSTTIQLVDIYNTFWKAFDDGKEVHAVFRDVSKAFDRVWHNRLLFKFNYAGINGTLLQLFTDCLNDRKQSGVSSEWCLKKAGVPQGSIIGPLLFLVFLNGIVEEINSSIRLFADDSSLYIVVDDPLDSAIKLNADHSRIEIWASM